MSTTDSVYLLDLAPFTYAEQALATSLQGLLNRESPRLFMRWNDASRPYDKAWMDYLPGKFDFTWQTIDSLDPLLEEAQTRAKGVVVWDADVPDTLNVAFTIAGLDDALVVTRDLLPRVAALQLPVLEDMTGRFLHSTRAELYRWSFQEHFPRCNKQWATCMDLPEHIITDLEPFKQQSPELRIRFESYEREHKDGGFDDSAKKGAQLLWMCIRSGDTTALQITVDSEADAKHRVDPTDQKHPEPDWADRRTFEYAIDCSDIEAPMLVANPHGTFIASISTDGGQTYTEIARREKPFLYGGYHRLNSSLEPADLAIAQRQFIFALGSVEENTPEERALFDEILDAWDPDVTILGWTTATSNELCYLQQVSKKDRVIAGGHSNPNFSLFRTCASPIRSPRQSWTPRRCT